ncbi:peptidoglycan editing factor PgeF [Bacillus luteolus]|uniref:Purine nucleoside phosphorylase n=1 Tax=Litchfieldia luteola TaxID=682179 RepID=A0ABR9QJY2_9BACI|nr:peptidoglycan editing factor PgeF [Cytobacillus luteolus]MBE4908807.1 peptidoglycan editing factor PgeF [Cytobacillus luteolus]MBP1941665.1 YfiH family protein [Cytobacillus luteolus]
MTKNLFSRQSEGILQLKSWENIDPSIVAGFTTKIGGFSDAPFQSFNMGLHVGDDSKLVGQNRDKLANAIGFPTSNWVCSEQVHDAEIMKVTRNHAGKGVYIYEQGIKGTDGLYTRERNLLLTLCFADCVPLYFSAPKYDLIGAAHAGWKGTVNDIGGKMIRIWDTEEKVSPEDIHVVIGPAIGSCCYIVDNSVIEKVNEVLTYDEYIPYKLVSEGQYSLDLKIANQLLLVQSGVPKDNIQVSSYCTSCEKELFFSHRRDKGQSGRMASYIGRKEDIGL